MERHRPRIERWLAGDAETRGLRLTKIHTLLVRDHGLRASYDTLWRFAHEKQRAAMMPPPEQLYGIPVWVDAAKEHPDIHIQIALLSTRRPRATWATTFALAPTALA